MSCHRPGRSGGKQRISWALNSVLPSRSQDRSDAGFASSRSLTAGDRKQPSPVQNWTLPGPLRAPGVEIANPQRDLPPPPQDKTPWQESQTQEDQEQRTRFGDGRWVKSQNAQRNWVHATGPGRYIVDVIERAAPAGGVPILGIRENCAAEICFVE